MDNFCARLKNLLKTKKLSQSDFAARLGLSQARFNNYLNGKTEASYLMLCSIASELDVSVDYLLGITLDCSGSTSQRMGCVSPIFAQTLEEGEDDYTTLIWIPAYNTAQSYESTSQLNTQADRWIKSDTMNHALFRNMYCLVQSDDSMAPEIMRGDKLFIAPAQYIHPAIERIDDTDIYAVRLSANDELGLHLRYCHVKDNIIFMRAANSKYSSVAFNISTLDFNPIAGKLVTLFR